MTAESEDFVVPPTGAMVTISERSLRVLLDLAMKADEALLGGSCTDGRPLPIDPETGSPYCAECWAMEEAQEILSAGPDREEPSGG